MFTSMCAWWNFLFCDTSWLLKSALQPRRGKLRIGIVLFQSPAGILTIYHKWISIRETLDIVMTDGRHRISEE